MRGDILDERLELLLETYTPEEIVEWRKAHLARMATLTDEEWEARQKSFVDSIDVDVTICDEDALSADYKRLEDLANKGDASLEQLARLVQLKVMLGL